MELTLEEVLKGGTHRVRLQHPTGAQALAGHTRSLDIRIPEAARDGMKIRVPKQGGDGVHGGPSGDLFLTIQFKPHPLYKPDEHDLSMSLPITPWEAAFGANVTVPTLDGGKIKLAIKPGAKSGQKLRLKNQGLPKKGGTRGDLIAELQIQVPSKPNKHEKELLEMLKNRSAFNPREWEK